MSTSTIVERPPLGRHEIRSRPTRVHARRGALLEVLLALVLVVFLGLLTLEWVTLTGLAGGFVKPFHVGAFGLIALGVVRWRPQRLLAPVLRRFAWIYGGYFLLLAAAGAGGLAYQQPYMARAALMRQASYVGASVVVAAVVASIAGTPRVQRILAWGGAVTVAIVTVGITVSLATQGANPVTLLRQALERGDPDIISNQLLRLAFRSNEDLATVNANLRHRIFLAVLIGTLAGLAFLPAIARRRRGVRGFLVVAGGLGFALVLLSLSRSTTLCLALTLALAPLRLLTRNRAVPRQMVVVGLTALVAAALTVTPVAGLITSRFGETKSYEARLESAGPGFLERFDEAAAFGTRDLTGASPHNLPLDAWLSGGILAFLCAMALLISYSRLWLREARRFVTGASGWVLPVGQLWVLGIGLIALVRAMTAGNQFHMVEWSSIGLFLGLILANQRAVRAMAAAGHAAGIGPSRRREP